MVEHGQYGGLTAERQSEPCSLIKCSKVDFTYDCIMED